jgi:hypothetical protein
MELLLERSNVTGMPVLGEKPSGSEPCEFAPVLDTRLCEFVDCVAVGSAVRPPALLQAMAATEMTLTAASMSGALRALARPIAGVSFI